MITSRDNKKIRYIKKLLKKASFRKSEGLFVLEGFKSVAEAVYHSLASEVYISDRTDMAALEDELGSLIKKRGDNRHDRPSELLKNIVTETVEDDIFYEVSDTVTPQGILAVVRMPEYDKALIYGREDARLLCLEDIRDPGNLGTMIRTCEAAGMDAIVLSKGCADVYQPKVVRSTMGSLLRVPCIECEDGFTAELERLSDRGYTLYAACLQGSTDYREAKYSGRLGLLIGNEASGLTDEAIGICRQRIRIPMCGEVESLNAAVSAAIIMYRMMR